MSAQLMAAGRPSYTLGTLHDGTTEEMAQLLMVITLILESMRLMKKSKPFITI